MYVFLCFLLVRIKNWLRCLMAPSHYLSPCIYVHPDSPGHMASPCHIKLISPQVLMPPGWLHIKMTTYQCKYRNSHYGDQTILWLLSLQWDFQCWKDQIFILNRTQLPKDGRLVLFILIAIQFVCLSICHIVCFRQASAGRVFDRGSFCGPHDTQATREGYHNIVITDTPREGDSFWNNHSTEGGQLQSNTVITTSVLSSVTCWRVRSWSVTLLVDPPLHHTICLFSLPLDIDVTALLTTIFYAATVKSLI